MLQIAQLSQALQVYGITPNSEEDMARLIALVAGMQRGLDEDKDGSSALYLVRRKIEIDDTAHVAAPPRMVYHACPKLGYYALTAACAWFTRLNWHIEFNHQAGLEVAWVLACLFGSLCISSQRN